ncbi:MAG: hypothetical protein GY708_18125 [Actinomycetia bacterium]|nr:hypothetical protein [Actinomycetes bacterium]
MTWCRNVALVTSALSASVRRAIEHEARVDATGATELVLGPANRYLGLYLAHRCSTCFDIAHVLVAEDSNDTPFARSDFGG